MRSYFSTRFACKAAMLACALLILCKNSPAQTDLAVTDSNLPINQGGFFLGGPLSNVVAVGWSQINIFSNATIAASLQSSNANFRTGTAYLMNSIGSGTTAANEIVAPVSFVAATPTFNDPFPLTVLFSGVNLEVGTYYLVLTAPFSPTVSPMGWQFATSPVITKNPQLTLDGTFTANTSFTTVDPFAPASAFGVDLVDHPILDIYQASQVIFLGVDSVTQGTWTYRYGSGGYVIPNGTATQLNYTAFSLAQYFDYTWAGFTSDPRALQTSPGATGGIASAITNYYGKSFYINLNIYDNRPHTVSFYLLDWDNTARSETITITDASTGQLYDTRTFSGFQNGEYAVWQLKGNLTVKVTPNTGPSAAVSGIFVD